ncbi:hypothetical protein [Salipaludibacillus sp. CF4.18]
MGTRLYVTCKQIVSIPAELGERKKEKGNCHMVYVTVPFLMATLAIE